MLHYTQQLWANVVCLLFGASKRFRWVELQTLMMMLCGLIIQASPFTLYAAIWSTVNVKVLIRAALKLKPFRLSLYQTPHWPLSPIFVLTTSIAVSCTGGVRLSCTWLKLGNHKEEILRLKTGNKKQCACHILGKTTCNREFNTTLSDQSSQLWFVGCTVNRYTSCFTVARVAAKEEFTGPGAVGTWITVTTRKPTCCQISYSWNVKDDSFILGQVMQRNRLKLTKPIS